MGTKNHSIIGKILIKGVVSNLSPLIIATGENDNFDFEVIRDGNNQPFIPAAGFAGMLRSELGISDEIWEYLWGSDGTKKNNTRQSHVIVDDLVLCEGSSNSISIRDGVAIDHVTNIAKDKSKYDYEVLEPNAKFVLNMEITIRKGWEVANILPYLKGMIDKGQKGKYQQGAFKSSGFGLILWNDISLYYYEFPRDGKSWLEYTNNETKLPLPLDLSKIIDRGFDEPNILTFVGKFEIKNSLMIGTEFIGEETEQDKSPNKTHLKDSKGNPLITAKSIKGPIRHRALKILNTLGVKDSELYINELFGYVSKDKKAVPSRVKTYECIISKATVDSEQIQPRTKIDRFTQGTIDTALMQTQPLWHKEELIEIKLDVKDSSEKDAGLLLMVMRDLMMEDLAIGGEKAIGRGVLKGKTLIISGKVNSNDVNVSFNNKGIIDIKDIDLINNWAKAINN